MKKYLKKLGVSVVVGLTALSIAGCSSDSSSTATSKEATSTSAAASSEKEMSVEERVAQAEKAQEDVENMKSKMTMEMNISSQGKTLDMNTTMDTVFFADPLKMKMDMNVDMGEMGSQYMAIYAEQSAEDAYTMYMTDGTQWQSEEVSVEAFDQYDTRNTIDTYLAGVTELKDAGKEEINGKQAVKIDGKITGDALEETIKYSGSLDSLKQTAGGQIDDATLEGLFHDLGEINVSLWLDEETNLPVKYSMDMTDVMAKLYENLFSAMDGAEDIDFTVSKVTIGVSDISYNDAEDFEIPAEAKQ